MTEQECLELHGYHRWGYYSADNVDAEGKPIKATRYPSRVYNGKESCRMCVWCGKIQIEKLNGFEEPTWVDKKGESENEQA